MHGGGAFPRKGGQPPEEGRGSAAHQLEKVMAMEEHMITHLVVLSALAPICSTLCYTRLAV